MPVVGIEMPPPSPAAELPETVLLMRVTVPLLLRMPPRTARRIAGDRAVGEGQRAPAVVDTADVNARGITRDGAIGEGYGAAAVAAFAVEDAPT